MTYAQSEGIGESRPAWGRPILYKDTKSFISKQMLARAAILQNRSVTIVNQDRPAHLTEVTSEEDQIKTVFSALHARNPAFSQFQGKLHAPLSGEFITNKRRTLSVTKRVNEPFVDSVPSAVFRVTDFVDKASNGSFNYTETNFTSSVMAFPGGHISVHKLAFSRDHSLLQGCRTIWWYKNSDKNQTIQSPITHFEF